jgi:threonine dehydrogenase-like Zn-dependent dehydrogenase
LCADQACAASSPAGNGVSFRHEHAEKTMKKLDVDVAIIGTGTAGMTAYRAPW